MVRITGLQGVRGEKVKMVLDANQQPDYKVCLNHVKVYPLS